MQICREHISKRRRRRYYRFRILNNLPPEKVFRESRRHIRLMILFLFSTTISLVLFNYISDDIGFYLGAYLAAISLFGYFVKLTLSFRFPLIILNRNGIKFLNSNRIKWSEIKSIKVKINGNSEQVVFIKKFSSKIIQKNLGKHFFPSLNLHCRSFLNNYRKDNYCSEQL